MDASRPPEDTPDRAFWDRTARRYTERAIDDPEGYARTLDLIRARLRPGDRVLELGCGSGGTAAILAPEVASYHATDISPRMIAIAEERHGGTSGLGFAVATVETVEAPEGGFDAVLALNYLHFLRDLPGGLARIRDLLAPSGLFVSKTPCLSDMNPLIGYAVLPVLRAIGRAPYVDRLRARELEAQIVVAGFEVEAVERHASRGRDTRPVIVARRVSPSSP